MLLKDRIAIITGGGRGIGKAISELYAQEGACVVVAARTEEQIDAVARAIREKGGRALPLMADVTDTADIKRMVEETTREFGRIDVLINNAGYAPPQEKIMNYDDEEWDKTLEVNLRAPYLCTKAALPGMIERKYGTIINLSSGLGKVGAAEFAAYCASKHAIIGFTKTLAMETGHLGITANVICPGPVKTEMLDHTSEEFVSARVEKTVIKRLVYPEEIAGMAVYLASDYARAISGQAIGVNGGNVMH